MAQLDLNLLGNSEEVGGHFVTTEYPSKEIWNHIRFICDPQYLKLNWKDNGKTDQDDLKQFIITSAEQAEQFYKAAEKADLYTRPLLFYYSFLALTKAILAIKTDEFPNDYHGLAKPEIGSDLTDFTIKAKNGIFLDLAKYLNCPITENRVFKLSEFCESTIELAQKYSTYYKKPRLTFPIEVQIKMSGAVTIKISSEQLAMAPNIENKFDNSDFIKNNFQKNKGQDIEYYTTSGFGHGYPELREKLYPELNKFFLFSVYYDEKYYFDTKETPLHQAVNYFGLSYILASIVRYFPHLLYKQVYDLEKSNKWFYENTCQDAMRAFPNLMLNVLMEKPFKFASHF